MLEAAADQYKLFDKTLIFRIQPIQSGRKEVPTVRKTTVVTPQMGNPHTPITIGALIVNEGQHLIPKNQQLLYYIVCILHIYYIFIYKIEYI